MFFIPFAAAAEVTVGGAVDAVGGLVLTDGEANGIAALRQVEGDVQVGDEGLNLRLDLDFSLTWDGTVGLAGVSPEWLALQGKAKEFRAAAGFFPAPWLAESRDPWNEPLVTPGATVLVLPNAMVGAMAGYGGEKFGVDAVVGLEGTPLDMVHPDQLVLTGNDALIGVHAGLDTESVDVGGGVYALPWRDVPFGAQLDVLADIGVVRILGEGVYGGGALGGQARVEVWPDSTLTPVARVEYVQGPGPGFAAGVSTLFEEMLRAKVEGSYRRGVPGIYAEVAVFASTKKKGASPGT